MCRCGIGVSKSIIMRATWKIRSRGATLHLPVIRETFKATAVQPVIHRTLLMESKVLVLQKWGQENVGVKGNMVIRKRNSITSEMQDVVKTRSEFTHKVVEF